MGKWTTLACLSTLFMLQIVSTYAAEWKAISVEDRVRRGVPGGFGDDGGFRATEMPITTTTTTTPPSPTPRIASTSTTQTTTTQTITTTIKAPIRQDVINRLCLKRKGWVPSQWRKECKQMMQRQKNKLSLMIQHGNVPSFPMPKL